jgi:hypothetical protein
MFSPPTVNDKKKMLECDPHCGSMAIMAHHWRKVA